MASSSHNFSYVFNASYIVNRTFESIKRPLHCNLLLLNLNYLKSLLRSILAEPFVKLR